VKGPDGRLAIRKVKLYTDANTSFPDGEESMDFFSTFGDKMKIVKSR
jgi:hypothetical protein